MRLPAFAGVSPFAHLLGRSAKKAAEEKYKDEDDEEKMKSKKAEMDDEDQEDGYAKKAVKADDDSEEEEDRKEEEADDTKKAKKSKAKKAEMDDEEDSDIDAKSDPATILAARVRERERCAAIFRSSAAGDNPIAAAHLAFDTDMPARTAIGVLQAMATQQREPEPRRGRQNLAERMARNPNPDLGTDAPGQPAAKSLAAQIIAAGRKARGEI